MQNSSRKKPSRVSRVEIKHRVFYLRVEKSASNVALSLPRSQQRTAAVLLPSLAFVQRFDRLTQAKVKPDRGLEIFR
jgi:hypothetical protein